LTILREILDRVIVKLLTVGEPRETAAESTSISVTLAKVFLPLALSEVRSAVGRLGKIVRSGGVRSEAEART